MEWRRFVTYLWNDPRRFTYPGGMGGWVHLFGWLYLLAKSHPGTNQAQHRITSLIETSIGISIGIIKWRDIVSVSLFYLDFF